jgi:acyl dehydratase
MTAAVLHTFATLPSMLPSYGRVVVSKKPLLAPVARVPAPIEIQVQRVALSASHIQRYRGVCGIPAAAGLPPAYLHIAAMPLHMRLFTMPEFPVKILGLIHLRNTITQYKPIASDENLKLTVTFDTMRDTPVGQEYDIVTRYEAAGQTVWEEVSTMLARRAPAAGGKRPTIDRSNHPKDGSVLTRSLAIAKNTGLRYAPVSGDFNPIHLMATTAKLFGFKQAVAHGMWSLARCLGEVADQLPAAPLRIDTQFKLPVYLPTSALLHCWKSSQGTDISLCMPKGDRLHLAMQVRPLV